MQHGDSEENLSRLARPVQTSHTSLRMAILPLSRYMHVEVEDCEVAMPFIRKAHESVASESLKISIWPWFRGDVMRLDHALCQTSSRKPRRLLSCGCCNRMVMEDRHERSR